MLTVPATFLRRPIAGQAPRTSYSPQERRWCVPRPNGCRGREVGKQGNTRLYEFAAVRCRGDHHFGSI